MSKICPFFSASAFASCAFLLFLSNSQSFGNLLVRWNHLASLRQTYSTLLTIPMHKDLSRGTLFMSKTCSQDSTSCTAFQCGRDSEATRRSCYAHHSTWKLRKQTQKLASVRNALFNHFCIFIQQINTASASVSFSQTRSIQIRGKFNS